MHKINLSDQKPTTAIVDGLVVDNLHFESFELRYNEPRLKRTNLAGNNLVRLHSQTWANDHLWIATICLQRPIFCGPFWHFNYINGSRGWSLYTGLTVFNLFIRYMMTYWKSYHIEYINFRTTQPHKCQPLSWISPSRSLQWSPLFTHCVIRFSMRHFSQSIVYHEVTRFCKNAFFNSLLLQFARGVTSSLGKSKSRKTGLLHFKAIFKYLIRKK